MRVARASAEFRHTSPTPLGTYTYRGEIAANTSRPFDAHSPWNYVTRAQGATHFMVAGAGGEEQHVWLGNQWVTAQEPGHPRNQDLLYFALLSFEADGSIQHLARQDAIHLSLPGGGGLARAAA